MLQVQVRAYFYRWKPHVSLEGEEWPFTAWELKITDGLMSVNQLLLRMPTTMVHVIDDDSPLAAWRTGRAAVATDSDSEIVVVVRLSFSACPLVFVTMLQHFVGLHSKVLGLKAAEGVGLKLAKGTGWKLGLSLGGLSVHAFCTAVGCMLKALIQKCTMQCDPNSSIIVINSVPCFLRVAK